MEALCYNRKQKEYVTSISEFANKSVFAYLESGFLNYSRFLFSLAKGRKGVISFNYTGVHTLLFC